MCVKVQLESKPHDSLERVISASLAYEVSRRHRKLMGRSLWKLDWPETRPWTLKRATQCLPLNTLWLMMKWPRVGPNGSIQGSIPIPMHTWRASEASWLSQWHKRGHAGTQWPGPQIPNFQQRARQTTQDILALHSSDMQEFWLLQLS